MNRGTDVPDFLAASQARVENPPPVQEHMQPGRGLLKAAVFRAVDRAGMVSLWPARKVWRIEAKLGIGVDIAIGIDWKST
jgi:hypothetical protein